MKPIIKICGFMRPIDISMCCWYGTNILGFVVDYPKPVPWNLSLASATELISTVPPSAETCIVTGGSPEKIISIALKAKPNYIQLHANETLAETAHLVSTLSVNGIKIIKTLFPNTPSIEKAAVDFCESGINALLFDARSPDRATQGGPADLSTFEKIRRVVSCPVILAGGITPENVVDIVTRSKAQVIDLMSGIEDHPGIKNEAKVARLFQSLSSL